MIRECFGEACDLDRMEACELIARRLQLHRGCVSCEITDVGPVEHLDGFSRTRKTGRRESTPESLKTDVSTGHTPFAGNLNDLNIVDAHNSFTIDVDQLFVEHVACEQHFSFTTHERTEV